jgi:hypothetical protein
VIVETSHKVTASQLKRSAFLYVRQSTPRQVLEHTESTVSFRQSCVSSSKVEKPKSALPLFLGGVGAFRGLYSDE